MEEENAQFWQMPIKLSVDFRWYKRLHGKSPDAHSYLPYLSLAMQVENLKEMFCLVVTFQSRKTFLTQADLQNSMSTSQLS